MIGTVVAAAIWALGAGLLLSIVLGAAVAGTIRLTRPSAAGRQTLWSVALGVAGFAPVVILAVMLVRGATPVRVVSEPETHLASVHVARTVAGPSLPTRVTVVTPPRAALGPNPPDLAPSAAGIIIAVWALGALIGLAGLARSLARVRGLKVRSSPLGGDLATELPWLTTLPGREIYVRLSYETETPIAVGFRRPVILLPTEMATAAGLTSIEPLIMHEYAHLARRDDWTNLAQRTIERVFWFNPLVWIIGRRIALEREVAADEAVVARTHDTKRYASALWQMAQEMRMPEHVVVAPGAMLTRKQISVRIERLLDEAPAAGARFGAAAFVVSALAVSGVAAVAAGAPQIILAPIVIIEPPPAPPTASPRRLATHPVTPQHAAPAKPRIVYIVKTDRVPVVAFAPSPPPDAPSPPMLPNLADQVRSDIARTKAEARRVAQDRRRYGTPDGIPPGITITRELFRGCTGCDFSHRDLHGLDLSNLTIVGNDLDGANLAGANFAGSNLSGLTLSRADLSHANLRGAHIIGVDLSGANLNGADLTNAMLTGVDLSHASFDGADTTGIRLIGTSFR